MSEKAQKIDDIDLAHELAVIDDEIFDIDALGKAVEKQRHALEKKVSKFTGSKDSYIPSPIQIEEIAKQREHKARIDKLKRDYEINPEEIDNEAKIIQELLDSCTEEMKAEYDDIYQDLWVSEEGVVAGYATSHEAAREASRIAELHKKQFIKEKNIDLDNCSSQKGEQVRRLFRAVLDSYQTGWAVSKRIGGDEYTTRIEVLTGVSLDAFTGYQQLDHFPNCRIVNHLTYLGDSPAISYSKLKESKTNS